MHREGLVEMVGQVLGRTGLPAGCLELEITEAVVLEETDWVVAILERLRSMGIQLAIDDFGTGYSSLSYLKNLPIDKLKIDKSLVADLPGTDSDVAIIRAVSALGANLGLTVIAEGVETAEQAGFLVGEGCRRGQGYLYSAPLPAGEFTTLLSP
jgi:EAL domain-containing protein (putative c-di-GMP-specific phosphodiesterase class I)